MAALVMHAFVESSDVGDTHSSQIYMLMWSGGENKSATTHARLHAEVPVTWSGGILLNQTPFIYINV